MIILPGIVSWLDGQIGSLRHDISGFCVPIGRAGSSDGDDLIRKWASDCLS